MKRTILALIFALNFAAVISGQSVEGTKDKVDQRLRSNGRVNPSTLGMEFDLPIGSYPGRGINLPLGLSYSSKVWRFEVEESSAPGFPNPSTWVKGIYSERTAAGWTSTLAVPWIELTGKENRFDQYGRPATSGYNCCYVRRITVHLPGASLELRAEDGPKALPTPGEFPPASAWEGWFHSSDGSGIKYFQDSNASPKIYKLYFPDGSFYDFDPNTGWDGISGRPAVRLADASGNYVQYNEPETQDGNDPYGSWTDQLGRVFPVMIPPYTIPQLMTESTYTDQFTLPGMSAPYTITWRRLSSVFPAGTGYATKYIGSTFFHTPIPSPTPWLFESEVLVANECSSGGANSSRHKLRVKAKNEYNWEGPEKRFDPMVLGKVELPNGAAYEFEYNEYGEVERIKYPTGGHEEFEYQPVASLAGISSAYQQANRGVEVRRVFENPSATPLVSTYSEAISDNNYRTTVVAPDGTQTDTFMHRGIKPKCDEGSPPEDFAFGGLKWGYDNVLAGKVYDTLVFNNDSPTKKIVQRTLTRWVTTATSVVIQSLWTGNTNLRTNPRVQSTLSTTYDGANGVAAATAFEYADEDAYGSPLNVTARKEYAFQTTSDGASFSPSAGPPSSVVALSDLTSGATLLRNTETTYETGSNYTAVNILRLPTLISVKDGSGNVKAKSQIVYDESTYLVTDSTTGTVPGWSNPSSSVRGLPTTSKSWSDITNNIYVQSNTQYNQFGSVRKTWDGNGNLSQIEYADNFSDNTNRHTYAFATKTISPVPGGNGSTTPFEATVKYKFPTGLTDSTTDINGQTTQMDYIDPATGYIDVLLRLHKVTAPSGHQTISEYGAGTSEPTRWLRTKSQIDASTWKEGLTWFDGLGRTIRSQSVDDDGDVFVLTCYDTAGRVSKVSNPFRNITIASPPCSTSLDWTTNTYDTAGRPWKVTTPDGAAVETAYSLAATGAQIGTVVTVKDQALKERRSVTNALGQLIRVDEPFGTSNPLGNIDAPNQPTYYVYDTLNNLTMVKQGGTFALPEQTRSFAYDSLSRLKSATNPESSQIQYAYDNNGNLQTKTDARTITTTYAYDALNRVKTRTYNDGTTPAVSYFYDNLTNAKGKLIKVSSSVSTTEYTVFDILGRVTASKQTTDGVTYGNGTTDSPMTYTYNLGGALVEQQYPSGRVVKNVLDASGDLSMVESKKNSSSGYWSYANSFTYNAAGAVTSMQLGNGRWESTVFNSRLQPTQIGLGTTPGAIDKLQLDYTYGTTSNNGNVQTQKITVKRSGQSDLVFDQTYTYDELNRLKIAEEKTGTTTNWKQTFTFDRYGNRRFDQANTTFPASFSNPNVTNPTFNTSNNRFASGQTWAYDSAGNITTDADSRTFIYDAENKQAEAKNSGGGSLGTYFFDGDGRRVKKVVPSSGETTVFVYDVAGRLVAEYSTIVAPVETAKVQYLTNDTLGTPRINTDRDGDITSRTDYMPYGEEIIGLGGRSGDDDYVADDVRQGFTGYIDDEETGLDYAQARMYAKNLGRFTGSDPAPFSPASPQELNRYVYVQNNPLRYIDPTGETLVIAGDDADFLVGELERQTGYKLKRDKKTGIVTIDGKRRKPGKGEKFSDKLADKLKQVTAETAKVNGKDMKFTVTLNTEKEGKGYYFDNFQKRSIDIGDYKTSMDVHDANGKGDGGAFVATQLGHVLEEYFQAETTYKDKESGGNGPNSELFRLSHDAAKIFEGQVLSGYTGSAEGKREERATDTTGIYKYKTVDYTVFLNSSANKSVQQIFRRPVPKQ